MICCLLNNVYIKKVLMAWGLYRSCLQTKKHDNQLSCLQDYRAGGNAWYRTFLLYEGGKKWRRLDSNLRVHRRRNRGGGGGGGGGGQLPPQDIRRGGIAPHNRPDSDTASPLY